ALRPVIFGQLACRRRVRFSDDCAGEAEQQAKSQACGAQPGHGSWTQPMTTPMAKRSTNAALGATDLSGNDIGNIIATDATPKTRPAAIPSRTLDIVWAVL